MQILINGVGKLHLKMLIFVEYFFNIFLEIASSNTK